MTPFSYLFERISVPSGVFVEGGSVFNGGGGKLFKYVGSKFMDWQSSSSDLSLQSIFPSQTLSIKTQVPSLQVYSSDAQAERMKYSWKFVYAKPQSDIAKKSVQ